jgi:hypothetical protein
VRAIPVWLWVLGLVGVGELVRGWLFRPRPRTWVIVPEADCAAGPSGAETADVLLRRIWWELGRHDRVVLVDDSLPCDLKRVFERLRARFPYETAAALALPCVDEVIRFVPG